MKQKKLVMITVRLNQSLKKKLDQYAKGEDRSVAQLLREIIRERVSKNAA